MNTKADTKPENMFDFCQSKQKKTKKQNKTKKKKNKIIPLQSTNKEERIDYLAEVCSSGQVRSSRSPGAFVMSRPWFL